VYKYLLDSDHRFRPQIKQIMQETSKQGGDSWPQLPSTTALLRLPKLVPNSLFPEISALDIQANPEKTEALEGKWRVWIDTHQDQLLNLKPTAKRIRFDVHYCAQAYPISR
jgi:hypothetical protein